MIVFVEFATEDDLNPDEGVRILEEVAVSLGSLNDHDRKAILSEISQIASEYRSEQNEDIAGFIEMLPENLGIE